MIFAVDIGNTNIAFGIFKDDKLITKYRLETRASATPDEYWAVISSLIHSRFENSGDIIKKIRGAIISSVVPKLSTTFEEIFSSYLKINTITVDADIKTPISSFKVKREELGADRIVNAAAGIKLYTPPFVIVDFGTATTFCVIDKNGTYLGGAISPGLSISGDALFQRASKLSSITLCAPVNPIGNCTKEAIRSGIILGHAAMVDGLIEKFEKELNYPLKTIATGGHAALITPLCKKITDIHETLIFEGLKILYYLNKGEKENFL